MKAGAAVTLPWLAAMFAFGCAGQQVVDIRVEGVQRTPREFVVNQMASRAGEPDSEAKRRLDFLYLDRLGIFSLIRIEPEPAPGGVVLRVRLEETFPVAPYASVTTTQDNGLAAGPGLGAINVFGRAYKANAAAEFGGSTNVFAKFGSPQLTRSPWSFTASFARAQRDNPVFDFTETSTNGGLAVRYQFRSDLLLSTKIEFLSLGSKESGVTLNPTGEDLTGSIAAGLRYDTRNSWSNPVHGWYLEAEASRHFVRGSPAGWWKGEFDARRYQTIAGRHGAAAFSLLSLQSGQPGVDLPTYMTFGIGGANTVRGWPVGARQGKHQWLNTLEYRYQWVRLRPVRLFGRFRVYWGLQLALYGDLGTAWTAPSDFSRNFIGGAGYGVRLIIPYAGMIRFDRAFGSGLRPAYGAGERADLWGARIR
jgi:outer membrane protein assembly factor BamA